MKIDVNRATDSLCVSLCCMFVTFDVSLVDERAVDVIGDCEDERDGARKKNAPRAMLGDINAL